MSLLTEFASSPIFSTVAGAVGGTIASVLGFFQKREDNKFALLKMDKEKELAVVMSDIEQTKQAGLLAALREKGAGEAFTASVEADGKLPRSYRWVDAFRSFTRPGLTWIYQVAFLLMSSFALLAWWRGWAAAEQVTPFVEYLVIAIINNANLCLSWWFGQRASDKATVAWGNKTTSAAVGPKAV